MEYKHIWWLRINWSFCQCYGGCCDGNLPLKFRASLVVFNIGNRFFNTLLLSWTNSIKYNFSLRLGFDKQCTWTAGTIQVLEIVPQLRISFYFWCCQWVFVEWFLTQGLFTWSVWKMRRVGRSARLYNLVIRTHAISDLNFRRQELRLDHLKCFNQVVWSWAGKSDNLLAVLDCHLCDILFLWCLRPITLLMVHVQTLDYTGSRLRPGQCILKLLQRISLRLRIRRYFRWMFWEHPDHNFLHVFWRLVSWDAEELVGWRWEGTAFYL